MRRPSAPQERMAHVSVDLHRLIERSSPEEILFHDHFLGRSGDSIAGLGDNRHR